MKLYAVLNDPEVLQYIKNQTEEICYVAVSQDGLTLRYVNDQSEEICLTAIRQNPSAIKYVKKLTRTMAEEAIYILTLLL